MIVEGFIDFDYEITLLTVRAVDGVHFCAPIGHRQEDGDYRESWQPQVMSGNALKAAQYTAEKVVNALGGHGIFGVELFVKGDHVIFNEVSPPTRYRLGYFDVSRFVGIRTTRSRVYRYADQINHAIRPMRISGYLRPRHIDKHPF